VFNLDELQVPVWQWGLSQGLGVVILILVVFAFQAKRKIVTLSLISACLAISVISNSLLLNWVAVALGGVTLLRFLCFIWLEARGERVQRWVSVSVLFFFLIACAVSVVVLEIIGLGHWFNWVLLAGNLFSTYGGWAKGVHLVRISNIQISILIIINALMFNNFMSIIIEAFALASIAIFYWRWLRKKTNTETATIPTENSDTPLP